jgi:hypothetical protein
MAYPEPAPTSVPLDLTAPSPLEKETNLLRKLGVGRSTLAAIDALGADEGPRERLRALKAALDRLDPDAVAELIAGAAKGTLAYHRPAIRVFFSLLDVQRPGVEVLAQLQPLASMERVSLGLISGEWMEGDDGDHANTVCTVLDVLREGARIGPLDPGIETLPPEPGAVRALFDKLRRWFGTTADRLEAGQRSEDDHLRFLAQLGMAEIALLEKRLARIAGSIDPHDARRMSRLLPVLSRYDQDIVHLKDVMSRLATYEPFSERLLTLEHRLDERAFGRILERLGKTPATAAPAAVLTALRENPVLSRPLAARVSMTHQAAALRAHERPGDPGLDPLSILVRVIERTDDDEMVFRVEEDVADRISPVLASWGALRLSPDLVAVPAGDDRSHDFVEEDGAPRFPHQPEPLEKKALDLKSLVRSQLSNDPFLVGILENPKATAVPGVVEIIAHQSRSLRVLDKICRTPSLTSGPANKNVPALILQNPARVPIQTVRRFVNVRYVSRVDLRHLARNPAALRPEVWREIDRYLRTLKK